MFSLEETLNVKRFNGALPVTWQSNRKLWIVTWWSVVWGNIFPVGRAVVSRKPKTWAAYLLLDSSWTYTTGLPKCVWGIWNSGRWRHFQTQKRDSLGTQPHNNHGFFEILQALWLVYLLLLQEVQRKLITLTADPSKQKHSSSCSMHVLLWSNGT